MGSDVQDGKMPTKTKRSVTSAPRKLRPIQGDRLKARREARGLTQKQLAKQIRINVKSLSDYETGKVQPRMENRLLILHALNGSWPDGKEVLGIESDPEITERHKGLVDVELRCVFRGEAARILGSRDAKITVSWTDDEDRLDERAVTALPDDVRRLATLADRLLKQLLGDAP